jgi:hypothetical protein
MNYTQRFEDQFDSPDEQVEERLLRAAVRLNTVLLGITMGLGSGLALFLATHLSLSLFGEQAGGHLNLLGVFLPGYSASPTGAWIGLFWGFSVGAFSGGLAYWLYARNTGQKLVELSLPEPSLGTGDGQSILRVSSHALGLALGCVMALQIFLTTSWLVLRGTADQSVHAKLLSNYLPGYSVGFVGGLIGAVELFAITYVSSLLLGRVYNLVAALRRRGSSK